MGEKIIVNMEVYANDVVDRLNALKNNHIRILSIKEKDTLNDTLDLILHNIEELKRP